jgi:solute carrier family 8 (sodium/calcium exchanger)
MAAIYHAVIGTPGGFQVPPGNLGFSVTIFVIEALLAIGILFLRRHPAVGGELGGPKSIKTVTSAIFVFFWIFYVLISAMQSYGTIDGF